MSTSSAPLPSPGGVPAPPPADDGPVAEVAKVYGLVVLITLLLSATAFVPGLALLHAYSGELVAMAFLVVAVVMAGRTGGVAHHGIALGGLIGPVPIPKGQHWARGPIESTLRETGVALLLALAVFPPFVVGYWLYFQPGAFSLRLSPDLFNLVAAQLMLVALPEEALFRGYIQTRLGDRFAPSDTNRWGVTAGVLVAQAGLFALIHLPSSPHPTRLAVFFPALLFGLLRAKRGGIGAALVFHALCNLLSDTLSRSWL